MNQILDSGTRSEFESGAVRDIVAGKGRCDLMPLDALASVVALSSPECSELLKYISDYIYDGDVSNLYVCIDQFCETFSQGDIFTASLEVSKHYEQGCEKYGVRNWEKGIPLHCYIDSGVRHLLKYFRGDEDEPHGRAFIWNMLGAIWTQTHSPKMIDLPFSAVKSSDIS